MSGPLPAHAAILSPMGIDERIRLSLGERHDICRAYVLGSCASGTARPGSDVDVRDPLRPPAHPPPLLDRLTEDLGAATECRVDLVVLNAAPPLLAREVIARGRLVMCRDEDERVWFVTRTTARYQDWPAFAACSTPPCASGPRRTVPVRAEIVRKRLLEIGESLGRLRSWSPVTVERLESDLMLQ